ncbi:MAG: DUF2283 domain-containing protein [Nitrospirae bacterium]|nr:DUF2283 domain-containing protein [Nitrospirota bacterium]
MRITYDSEVDALYIRS